MPCVSSPIARMQEPAHQMPPALWPSEDLISLLAATTSSCRVFLPISFAQALLLGGSHVTCGTLACGAVWENVVLSHAAPGIQKGRRTTYRASYVIFPSFYSFELLLKCFVNCPNKSFIPILTIFAAKSYDSGHEPRLRQIYQLDSGKSLGEKLPWGM